MSKTYGPFQITLDRNDLGQMLDGLEVRRKQWEDTAKYLESGSSDVDFFVPEDCSDASEAKHLAKWYGRIISTINRQINAQAALSKSGGSRHRCARNKPTKVDKSAGRFPKSGYCIYIDTLCQGPVPSVADKDGYVVFQSEVEAQKEIVDFIMIRLREFLDGERDYEDAVTLEEYVVPVTLLKDGVITDEDGNCFGPTSA